MKGNGSQTGTPTPDNPVSFNGVGERTGNLINLSEQTISFSKLTVRAKGSVVTFEGNGFTGELYGSNAKWKTLTFDLPAGTYTINRTPRPCSFNGMMIYVYDSSGNRLAAEGTNTTFTLQEDTTCSLGFYVYKQQADDVYTYSVMINAGGTALPYEPYGWKIPLTCAGQTLPVYLGQAQTVRKIRKLVLDGTERWLVNWRPVTGTYAALLIDSTKKIDNVLLCTHLELKKYDQLYYTDTVGVSTVQYSTYLIAIRVPDAIASNDTEFKAWLAAQYANGTPVTVWYVLAEPETAIVNEPLAKIGDYADELHSTDAGVTIPTAKGSNTLTVDTTVQPSEMMITGNIK
jgi:hypothetical protein